MGIEDNNSVLADVQTYIKSEYDILRLKATKRASLIGGSVLLVVCVLFLAFLAIVFMAIGATIALADCLPLWAAFLITGGVFLLLILVLLLCKKVFFVNPVVRVLSEKKSLDELDKDTLRAEGRVTMMRERALNRANVLQTAIDIRLFRLGLKFVRRFFDLH